MLFVPTVIMNGSMWGQCDVLFTAALVATVYCLATGRSVPACVAYGIAFSFKLQAIFLAPLLLVAWLARRVRFGDLLWVPGVHLLTLHPAAYLGRPVGKLLTIYLDQSRTYKWLQSSAPNIYQWMPNDYYDVVMPIGVGATAVVVAGLVAAVFRRHPELTAETWVSLALLFALVVPSVLPGMHERYFYAADVFSVIYAFCFPRRFYVAVVTVTASTMAYMPYLFGRSMPLKLAAVALVACTVFVAVRLLRGPASAGAGAPVPTPVPSRNPEEPSPR